MSALNITANYEQLEQIASQFGQTADEMDALRNTLTQQVDELYTDGWRGEGSNKFFAEMDGDVLPALRQLNDAFLEAQQVALKTVVIFREAEQGASKLFKGNGNINFDAGATATEAGFGALDIGISEFIKRSSLFSNAARKLTSKLPIGGVLDYIAGGITDGEWGGDYAATQLISDGGQALVIAGVTAGAVALGVSAPVVAGAFAVYAGAQVLSGFGQSFTEHTANQTQDKDIGGAAKMWGKVNDWVSLDHWADKGARMTVDTSIDIYEDASEAVKQYIF